MFKKRAAAFERSTILQEGPSTNIRFPIGSRILLIQQITSLKQYLEIYGEETVQRLLDRPNGRQIYDLIMSEEQDQDIRRSNAA